GCSKKSTAENPDPPAPPPPSVTNEVEFWLTKSDRSVLLAKQNVVLGFDTKTNSFPGITVDTTKKFQDVDGFGYTLTGGSATLINSLPAAIKSNLLQELFGNTAQSIGVSYLRISIGASDLSANVYTYDDVPAGETDPTL